MWLIRAHFDGRFIVPDEPVDLPLNTPLHLKLVEEVAQTNGTANEDSVQRRLQQLALATGCVDGPSLPSDSLRRENFYDERL